MRKKTENIREYIVSDSKENYFAGYKKGELFWTDQISLAKELKEESHYTSLIRWAPTRKLKQEFI